MTGGIFAKVNTEVTDFEELFLLIGCNRRLQPPEIRFLTFSLVKLPSLVYLTMSAYKFDKNELQPPVKMLLS